MQDENQIADSDVSEVTEIESIIALAQEEQQVQEAIESLPEPVAAVAAVAETINAGAQSISCHLVALVQRWQLPTWVAPIVTGTLLMTALALIAFLIFFIIRPFVLGLFTKIAKKTDTKLDDKLVKYGIARWSSHFISALVLIFFLPGFIIGTPEIGRMISILCRIYLILSGLLMVNAYINGARSVFIGSTASRRVPSRSLMQVLKILTTIVALILTVCTITEKSPLAFLGGLGVFTSVIMLVFKDSILGFVAGIQLTSNDMIREGDWIEMPKHGADGNVTEIALTTVKVMNFDKTITTIPTYSMISESFKNWRTMPESGGRRIKRSIYIDVHTIQLCSDDMLNRFRDIDLISSYIDQRSNEVNLWNNNNGVDSEASIVNGRQLTNIGTFRAYIEAYLRSHPFIHKEGMTLIVRQLSSEPTGIPIQIYCFSNIVNWSDYEKVQSDIFDHLFAIAGAFDLKIFQNPSTIESETNVQMYGLQHTGISSEHKLGRK